MILLKWGFQNSQTQRSKDENGSFKGVGVGRSGELLFNGYSCSYTRWMSSKDLLYNTVTIVGNRVLCTSKFVKRSDLMLSVLTNKQTNKGAGVEKTQGNWEVRICLLLSSWWGYHGHMHTSKIIKLYTLDMFSFFQYINYSSVKLFKV